MTEISVTTKIIISFVFLLMFAISAFYTWRIFRMYKTLKQAQKDRDHLLENHTSWKLEMIKKNPELSDTDKKLIITALTLPEFEKEIKAQGLKEVYEHLKKKIKDSIDD